MGRSVEQEDYIKKYREERINKNEEVLKNNDSYHALDKIGGLIKTGATGTNVNDIAVILCK